MLALPGSLAFSKLRFGFGLAMLMPPFGHEARTA
jgi:hypothetical protein